MNDFKSAVLNINESMKKELVMNKTTRHGQLKTNLSSAGLLSEKKYSGIPLSLDIATKTNMMNQVQRTNSITLPIDKINENSDISSQNFSPISHMAAEQDKPALQKNFSPVHKIKSFADT